MNNSDLGRSVNGHAQDHRSFYRGQNSVDVDERFEGYIMVSRCSIMEPEIQRDTESSDTKAKQRERLEIHLDGRHKRRLP